MSKEISDIKAAIVLIAQQQQAQTQLLERVAAVEEQMASLSQRLLDVIEQDRRERQKQQSEDLLEIPIAQAFKTLGYNTVHALRDRIKDGYYRLGVEAMDRRKEGSKIPIYYVNVGACRRRDRENPARRAN